MPGYRVRLKEAAKAEEPLTVEEVAQRFRYARREQVLQLLETLDRLGLVRPAGDGAYAG